MTASAPIRGAVASCLVCSERIGQFAVTAAKPSYLAALVASLRVTTRYATCPRCGAHGQVQWALAGAAEPNQEVAEAMRGPAVPRVVGRRVTVENMR